MLLKEWLIENYMQEELADYAGVIGAVSSEEAEQMEASDLAEKTAAFLLQPEIMRKRLGVMTDAQERLFDRLTEENMIYNPARQDADLVLQLAEMDYAFLSRDDVLVLPDDVKEVFRSEVDTPDFRRTRRMTGWLMECLWYAGAFYAVVPADTMLRLYAVRPGFRANLAELKELMKGIPQDLTEMYFTGENFISAEYMEPDRMEALLKEQGDHTYCLPDWHEIRDYWDNQYISENAAYKALQEFLTGGCGLETDRVDELLSEAWAEFEIGDTAEQFLEKAKEAGFVLTDPAQAKRFEDLVKQCRENTRMLPLRGAMPCEAASLKVVDSSGTRVRSGKKIYPNDPCPCGSGKKYKQCCGRRTAVKTVSEK